jgi:hypothetical protein
MNQVCIQESRIGAPTKYTSVTILKSDSDCTVGPLDRGVDPSTIMNELEDSELLGVCI